MSNVELVKGNVEISETVDKSMINNNNVQKELINKPTFDSVINESELSIKHDITTSNNNESLLNNHESVNHNNDEFTANCLIFNNVGLLNYGKKN